SHPFDDFVQLALCQLRIDRQREDLFRRALGFGKRALLVAEVGKAGLQVERQWIVDRASDPAVLEETLKVIATIGANRVLVEYRFIGPLDEWNGEPGDIG